MPDMTLAQFRAARGLPMDALAILGQVAPSTISRIEAGKQKPSPETVVRLARALGVSARRMQAMCEASAARAPGVTVEPIGASPLGGDGP